MDSEKTQNSILRISDEKTLRLVELYSQEECLWNTHLNEYKHKAKRAEAAERIAKALNIRHFGARHVMIKFKNLRNSYCQELKKIAHSESSLDDSAEVYKPRVFWFSTMDSFLRPHLHQTHQSRAHSTTAASSDSTEFIKKEPEMEDVEEWIQMANPAAVEFASSQYTDNSCSEHDDPTYGPPRAHREPAAPARKASKRARREAAFEQQLMCHSMKDISSQMNELLSRSNDHFERFGSYIASLLRVLPPQSALMIQPKIVALIASAVSEGHEGRASQSDSGSDTK